MKVDEYIAFLTSHIKPFAKLVAGRKEINCRCFYCADSSNRNKGHFYISVPKEDEPSFFYCQKCHTQGIVTNERLMEWGIFDSQMGIELTRFNTKVLAMTKDKGERASRKLSSKKGYYGIMLALILFVGIPLPGTGAWTGTLGASFLNLDLKTTSIAVMLGVILSGVVMAAITMFGIHIFGL